MSILVWRHPPALGSNSLTGTRSGWIGDGVTRYLNLRAVPGQAVLALAHPKSTVSHRPDLVYSPWDSQSDSHL